MKFRLFNTLAREGLIDEARWQECCQEEKSTGEPIDKILKEKGYLTEDQLLQAFHKTTGIPYHRNLGSAHVPDEFVKRVTSQFARQNNLIAVSQSNGSYQVATCEPLNVHAMDELSTMLEAEVDPVLAPKTEITQLITRAYQRSVDGVDEMLEGIDDEEDVLGLQVEIDEAENVLDIANKAPIIRLVNSIFFEAVKVRASDIHFQPYEDKLQVRYRIDGILYDTKIVPKKVQEAVTSRIKVMGRMDIAERRLPQDGRATIKVGDGEIDLRISSVPTNYGERVVLRLLDKTVKVYTLDGIGLTPDNYDLLSKFVDYSHGIILVTGPTGSGKTTTLYAAMSKINSPELNILTIEDPIEYHLPGISQIQVSNKKGLTFAAGLRSLLRQDPDIIMVGEIRDQETARIAIQAALTGHLVFSTVHTNDSASTVTRLVDIGVEPYLVASSVVCVVAQRLVRVICDECKSEYEPTDEELAEISLTKEEVEAKGARLAIGMGCGRCFNTGYLGRTAIYEILPINDTVRQQVMERASATTIKQSAVAGGLRTLRMDGAQKVLAGQSTIEEVLRVTQMDLF